MTRRFTETNKWEDKWYRKLPLPARELFNFLCDKCDVAGFWQMDLETAAFFVGLPEKEDTSLGQRAGDSIEAALDVLLKPTEEGAVSKILINQERTWLYVTNFLRHQGNWPLKEKNNITAGILRCFSERKSFGKEVLSVLEVLNGGALLESEKGGSEGPSKGLPSPIGKGKGNGKGNGSLPEEGCRGETQTGSADIVAAWNESVPEKLHAPEDGTPAMDRQYSGCVQDPPAIGHDEIRAAVANYGRALALPDSQAGHHSLGKFLVGLRDPKSTGKYLPGNFNLEDFRKSNFRSRDGPTGEHLCRGRDGNRCANPGTHRHRDTDQRDYWYCDEHEQVGHKKP
jgi:hypothetical protein